MTTLKNPSAVIATSTLKAKRSRRTRKGKCDNLLNEFKDWASRYLETYNVRGDIFNMKTTFILPESKSIIKRGYDNTTQNLSQFYLTIIQSFIWQTNSTDFRHWNRQHSWHIWNILAYCSNLNLNKVAFIFKNLTNTLSNIIWLLTLKKYVSTKITDNF
jgi:hypothetical protein